jgi:uncharacterized protein
MRWDDFRPSDNIEDRRGTDGGAFGGGMFGGRIPGGGGGRKGLGLGTLLVLGLAGYALGIDPRLLIAGAELLSGGEGPAITQPIQPGVEGSPKDEEGRFVAAVLGNTEDVWKDLFQSQLNTTYHPPGLVLFSGATRSGCGFAQAATGPFYCPLDTKVYIDLSFFAEMRSRLGGGGDFAYAYVIAHEVGHHIQQKTGLLARVRQRQEAVGQTGANALQVRVELMADCLAGIWAHHSESRYRSLEPGDIEEAQRTAAAIGDDRLQRQGQGTVRPESFTHGTSEQRVRWFTTGLKEGRITSCNTLQGAL